MGILYITTPLIWYIPALVYRVINPDANPEQAYMLMSQHLLGVGMLGLMLAAMLSATMSAVSSNLNVFANVFAYDIFRAARPDASDKTLIRVGRVFTYVYGALITGVAIMIPYLGGAERVVVPTLTLIISPLFIPSIWGLFSKRIGSSAAWWSMSITYTIAFVIKVGFFDDIVNQHVEFVDAFIGFVVPFATLLIIELALWKKEKDAGWGRLVQISEEEINDEATEEKNKKAGSLYSSLAINIMMGTYLTIGIIIAILAFVTDADSGRMLLYASIFIVVSIVVLTVYHYRKSKLEKKIINNG